ncbi:TlpA family protein disulfide reductase [Pedobacter cryophilus]|uniref:TlpA family protein disulfide reductase n=1 Tax=Pedobacter cryophilus TaxID=2571271 RepID=A0A4U1BZD3_9SPHI|nr:TlpA disulfide reductase family protein [Pedobacter cryophilus]TKB98638.1 TlpA family protein disulfide reductase [Pedobacter cryophilus]
MKINIPIITKLWRLYKERQEYKKQIKIRLLRRQLNKGRKVVETEHWTNRYLEEDREGEQGLKNKEQGTEIKEEKYAAIGAQFSVFAFIGIIPDAKSVLGWKFIIPIFLLLLLLAFLPVMVKAELKSDSSTTLKIGDQVPDLTLKNITNYKSATAKLSDFKGKLVILDFWATWCGACVAHLPDVAKLQQEFDGRLQVILVNAEAKASEQQLQSFLKKHIGTFPPLPLILNDHQLKPLFPFTSIPHYVWISPEGKLLAITGAAELNREQVSQSLQQPSAVKFVTKVNLDLKQPLFLKENATLSQVQAYQIVLKGWISGPGSGVHFRKNGTTVFGLSITNKSLESLYRFINNHQKGLMPMMNVKEVAGDFAEPKEASQKALWNKENLWSVDVQVPLNQAHLLYDRLLETLNQNSPYMAQIETRQLPAWGLEKLPDFGKTAKAKATLQSGGLMIQQQSTSFLVNCLNAQGLSLPVVDRTNFEGLLDLQLSGALHTVDAINQELLPYGLCLKEGVYPVKLFSISKKESPLQTQTK